MTTNTNEPRNAQQAMAAAVRLERAKAIITEGYRFTQDADSEVVAVCKPGELHASYWINLLSEGCDCPDRLKGNRCKHEIAYALIQEEAADELAGLEWQCARYDDYEGYLDKIPTPTLTKDVLRAMEQDLQKVNADIDAQAERRTGYIHAEHLRQRAGRLENAIVTVNQYRCPADVPPSQFCTVCGIANLHGPRCFGEDCPNRIR